MNKARALELIASKDNADLKLFLGNWMSAYMADGDPAEDDDSEDGVDIDRYFYSQFEGIADEGEVFLGVEIVQVDRGARHDSTEFSDVFMMTDADTNEELGLFAVVGTYSSWDRPEYETVQVVYERKIVATIYLTDAELDDPSYQFYEGL
jgi:hypothetical protein